MGCCVGGAVSAVSGTCCGVVSLVNVRVASSSCLSELLLYVLSSINPTLFTFQKQSVSHLKVLVNYCRCLRPNPRSLLRRPSFFEVVGCLVSSARIDGRCRALFDYVIKNQTNGYITKWNTQNSNLKKKDGS